MLGDATAVSQVSLNKKWYETDSYKDVREIDILEAVKRAGAGIIATYWATEVARLLH